MSAGYLKNFDAGAVLSGLHGFQRDAADYAFHRLFTAPDSTRRFLIADEVGLGKTLVARGVLARAIEHLRDKVDRVDVVYICSNLSIARQNIHRLNPLQEREFADAQRITLLPLHMQDVRSGDVNLVAFTPGTSLNLTQNLGIRRERILLYTLLKQIWDIPGVGALNVLQGEVQNTDAFRREARDLQADFVSREATATVTKAYAEELSRDPSVQQRFQALCERFKRTRQHIPEEERTERNSVVGLLRATLARVCIASLEPDLIILDEFQRFKDLLEPNSEAGEFARQLFDWSNGSARAHVLLLSATPYKPYTLRHEIHEDDHYADFLRTVRFLHNGSGSTKALEGSIRHFRRELLKGSSLSIAQLEKLKGEIEGGLRCVMSRTERLVAAGEHNGMLRSVVSDLAVDAEDLRSYVDMRRLSDLIEVDDPLEYWKSAPYAMNFMEGYKFAEALREHVAAGSASELAAQAQGHVRSALHASALTAFEQIAFPNSKFRQLAADLEAMAAFDLLWLPPSLPAYQCEGPFKRAAESGLTKRLIFSAWNVVPRSIAALLSYDAERRGVTADPAAGTEAESANVERGALLKVSLTEGRKSGMPTLALMYPARALARLCDPRELVRERAGRIPSLAEALEWAKARVRAALPSGITWAEEGKASDESWYWAAPIILDSVSDPDGTRLWFEQPQLAALWSGHDNNQGDDDDETVDAGWVEHVAEAASMGCGARLAGPAPSDLVDVLALLGLAGPGVCALRALSRAYPAEAASAEGCVRAAAAQLGWSFRRLLNRPQSTALIRRGDRAKPFWRLALEYCARGCLSSVLEEYIHVLRDSTGSSALPADKACSELSRAANEALGIRTATLTVDDIRAAPENAGIEIRDLRMRSLFAMRFGSDKTEDDKQAVRDSAVRAAFNSPFWPFVLASTSVGQEGLDFHWYCHAVVHWNLPSNPVDLEQREGRVHRFKGHAVRKNVATKYAAAALCSLKDDVWHAAFEAATTERAATDRGLVPYWLFPLEGGAWVERHVPLYALSRDEIRYRNLQKELGAYRLVFGQPRQDELLAYLLGTIDAVKLKELMGLLRVDLTPPSTE